MSLDRTSYAAESVTGRMPVQTSLNGDAGYEAWLTANPSGWLVNARRSTRVMQLISSGHAPSQETTSLPGGAPRKG